MEELFKSIRIGTVDFFGIFIPGLLTVVISIIGFFIPIFLLLPGVANVIAIWIMPDAPTLVPILLVLAVISYVLGYILRLSSPDELDKISARNVILQELDRLNEQDEKYPTEKSVGQNHKVAFWFRLIMQRTKLRKYIKRIAKDLVEKEEKKFEAFIAEDKWPYNPDEPLDKYPYFNFRPYLEHRGHRHLDGLVDWGPEEGLRLKRSKTAVNKMKILVRQYCPQLLGLLDSKEGHIRLMAGTWSAFKVSYPLAAIAWAILLIFVFTSQSTQWYAIYAFVDFNLLLIMHFSIKQIEKLFHYRRVNELFHIVQAAYLAQQKETETKGT